jgi:hypothetical protein
MELARGRGTPRLRSYWLSRVFGKCLANDFLSVSPPTEKSENNRINTGIYGGPGWTWTTDLALIRVAWLGLTRTYKYRGDCLRPRKSYKTTQIVGSVVG